jgi:hypothetical protein
LSLTELLEEQQSSMSERETQNTPLEEHKEENQSPKRDLALDVSLPKPVIDKALSLSDLLEEHEKGKILCKLVI